MSAECEICGEPAELIGDVECVELCEACACERAQLGEMSTTDTLSLYGMSHHRSPDAGPLGMEHDITCDGEVVFAGKAWETTAWLREQGLMTEAA